MVDDNKRTLKVIVPKDSLPLKIGQHDSEGFHITLVFCVAADGEAMKPALILPLVEFPLSLEEVVKKFHWAGQSAGWMTEDIFKSWVIEAFIPHVERRRTELKAERERAILFIDSHESRRSPEALEALRQANIDVYTFLSHSTHVVQPLDCGVNRAFKTKLRAAKSDRSAASLGERRLNLLRKCAKACHEALYDETILKAWAQSGLYPWNVESTLKSPYVIDQVPPDLAKKRKRSNIKLSERLLTDENLIKELKERKVEADKPKRPRGRPPKKQAKLSPESDLQNSNESENG